MKAIFRYLISFAALFALHAYAESPSGMKLYVLNSGPLTLPEGMLTNLKPMTPPIQVPVAMFVVKHPRGNVLFDTGNNDKIIEDPSYWGKYFESFKVVNTPDISIEAQLGRVGLSPEDIDFVVVSHMHLDHGGNVWKFPKSTLVIQRDELEYAFFPDEPFAGAFIPGDVNPLRSGLGETQPNSMNMIRLMGDHDLFGDGSVIVKRSRGHTKGSQMLLVRLPNTGSVILTGDSAYFRDNVFKRQLPNIALAYDPPGIIRGYDWIMEVMAREDADFFCSHDPDQFKTLKKPPEFYD
ncbi:MAG: N-acyl homoserine lactonase family protein [Pseudomonadota bacterium]